MGVCANCGGEFSELTDGLCDHCYEIVEEDYMADAEDYEEDEEESNFEFDDEDY